MAIRTLRVGDTMASNLVVKLRRNSHKNGDKMASNLVVKQPRNQHEMGDKAGFMYFIKGNQEVRRKRVFSPGANSVLTSRTKWSFCDKMVLKSCTIWS